jgi:TraM recognition site of TraD and TraG
MKNNLNAFAQILAILSISLLIAGITEPIWYSYVSSELSIKLSKMLWDVYSFFLVPTFSDAVLRLTAIILLFFAVANSINIQKKVNIKIVITTSCLIVAFVFISYLTNFLNYLMPYSIRAVLNISLSLACIYFLIEPFTIIGNYLYSFFGIEQNSKKSILNQKKYDQQKRLIENELSVNIKYIPRGSNSRDIHYLNLIEPNSSVLLLGMTRKGKTFGIILSMLDQWIKKEFTGIIYDYKDGELTDWVIKYHRRYKLENPSKKVAELVVMNFKNPLQGYRINPMDRSILMEDDFCSNVIESVLKTLNKKWIDHNDFWSDNTVSFSLAGAKLLRNKKLKVTREDGAIYEKDCCSLAHLIALMTCSVDNYDKIYAMMNYEKNIPNLLSFLEPLRKNNYETVSNLMSSVLTEWSKLNTEKIMFLVSEFQNSPFAINDKNNPQIIVIKYDNRLGKTYAAVASSILSQAALIMNQDGKQKSFFMIDEAGTVFIKGLEDLIATGGSRKVCPVLVFQDQSQINRDYGRDSGEVLVNTCGNKIAFQVDGKTAEYISHLFGETEKAVHSYTFQENGTKSTSVSRQRKKILEPSDISQFGVGEFCARVANNYKAELTEITSVGKIIIDDNRDKILESGDLYPIIDQEFLNKSEEEINSIFSNNYYRIYKEVEELVIQQSREFQQKHQGDPLYPKTSVA